ncbi:MAG: single-stranded DNA-binding protein [Bacteroidota bacterium]|jgi:single-strand DNA-binding protein
MVRMQAIGNLGKDAVTNTVNGKTVINFTVAHTEKGRDRDAQGNPKDKTIWVDCAYWTEKTAVAQYLKKGTQVYVEGQPDIRTYTTQDGRNGASLTLRVGNLQLLGGRSGDNSSSDAGNNSGGYSSSSPAESGGGEEAPF